MDEQTQKEYEQFRENIDISQYKNEPYVRKIEKPWGYELHLTPDNLPYMMKILHVDEGKRLSLQSHDVKQESWTLAAGNAILLIENENGEMEEIDLKPGVGYTCKLGQKHRLKGGEGGGDVFEASTPEVGNTYRLEDDYARPTETEELRKKRNEEAL